MSPQGTSVTWPANTNGHTSNFTVTNSGLCLDTFNYSASGTGGITGISVSPSGSTLSANQQTTVTVTYNVTTGGSATLTLNVSASRGGEQTSGYYNVTVTAPAVSVTPKGGTAPSRYANSSGYNQTFTVTNTGNVQTTYSLSCSGSSNVSCTGVGPSSVTLAPQAAATDTAYYNVGAVGTGTLSLTASGSGSTDVGSYSVPVVAAPPFTVGPKGSSTVVFPNTSGTASFTLQNLVNGYSYSFTWSCSGGVTNCTSAPGNPPTTFTASAYGQNVSINFSDGWPWTGRVTLTVYGNTGGGTDSGWYNIALNSNGPAVATLPTNGDYRDVSKCVANCFDAVASYATPPYFSADMPHTVQLVYRSTQARPMGVVQVDALDTSTIAPVKMSIRLYASQGYWVTFTNNSTEIFYNWVSHPADGNVNRLAAQFDASSLTTGAYNYTAVVRSYRSDGSFRETDVPVRVLIANESNSPFGAGWQISGFQRGFLQGDGSVVIAEGDGSIAYFAVGYTTCYPSGVCTTPYAAPPGDFTSLTKTTGGTCTTPPCPTYQRAYPGGSTVGFDQNLRVIALGGITYMGPDPRRVRFGMSKEEVSRLPTIVIYVPSATFAYDGSNSLVGISDSTGNAYALGYDATHHLNWIKDPGGRVDSITIDASGNLAQIRDWGYLNLQGGRPLTFQYDGNHRLLHRTDRRGGAWGFAYDFAGKVAVDTAPQVTANGVPVRPVVLYASTEQMVLINPATGLGSSSSPGPNVDTATVRATVTNPRGYTTTFALDRFGADTRVQEPLGRTTSITRDANSVMVRHVAPSGHVLKYAWSGPDLMQLFDSTTGRTINYTYTAHHLAQVSGDADSVVNQWTGNTLQSTHTGGSGSTTYTYAPDGRLCGIVDPGGHQSTCNFTSTSGFKNTDSVKYTLGTVGYRYDGHGQLIARIDQILNTTTVRYDSIGRPIARIGPVNDLTAFTYDELYLVNVTDAKGQTYQIWPNALGWADSTKDPAGLMDRYQYDVNGNRTSWTNRKGQTISFTYDALDQPSSIVADSKTTTYFNDPAGRYRADSNSESIDTLRFDAADRPWVAISCRVLATGSPRQCFRDSATYEIRDVETQTVLSAPTWGSTQLLVGHHYDVHMLLDSLKPGYLNTQTPQPIAFRYSAEALDSVRTLTGLNNLTITHSYPWTHRTDQVQLSDPTLTAVLGWAYNFDNAARLGTRFHGSLANPDTARTFTYDPQWNVGQYNDTLHHYTTTCTWYQCGYFCTGSDQPSFVRRASYTYDSVGNRKDPSAANGGLDPANRLRRWQNLRMDYDVVGNLTAKRTLSTADTTRVLRTDSLFWSSLGSLDSVHTRDSTNMLIGRGVGFGYDGSGRRIRKSIANGTNRYIWHGDNLFAQLDTLGSGVAWYTYYPGLDNVSSVLRHDRGDSTYYYVQDYSGNVVALLARTSTGIAIDNQYRYDPFGNVQGSSTTSVPNVLQLAGREYDAETQLYYDRARYIDPTVGRFVSEDPIGLKGGINLYAFVGNDPVNRSDPSGTAEGLCGNFSTHQLTFLGKLGHVSLGYAFYEFLTNAPYQKDKGWAVAATAAFGLWHELSDRDLTSNTGAPCHGLVDWALYLPYPLWALSNFWPIGSDPLRGIWPFGTLTIVPDPLSGGNPFPNAFPPYPGGLPGWAPSIPGLFLPPTIPSVPQGPTL